IGAEVEEDDAVAVVDALAYARGRVGKHVGVDDHRRLYELVRLTPGVSGGDSLQRGRGTVGCFAADDGLVGRLRALPGTVTVHRVIAPGDAGDPGVDAYGPQIGKLGLDRLQITAGAVRRAVAPVGEGVNSYPRNALALGEFQEGYEVIDVAVNTAVAYQPQ